MPFATLFIEFGLEHFIDLVILWICRHATLIALRPIARGGGRGALRYKVFVMIRFEIRIIVIGPTNFRSGPRGRTRSGARGSRTGGVRTIFATSSASATSTATTATRAAIFTTFAIARRPTGGAIFVARLFFIDGRRRGKFIIDEGLCVERFDGFHMLAAGRFLARLFFVAAATATSTAAATGMVTFFVAGPIETESLFGGRGLVTQFFARRNEVVFEMFGGGFGVSWLPIFAQAVTKTTAGWIFTARLAFAAGLIFARTTFFVAAVITASRAIAA